MEPETAMESGKELEFERHDGTVIVQHAVSSLFHLCSS